MCFGNRSEYSRSIQMMIVVILGAGCARSDSAPADIEQSEATPVTFAPSRAFRNRKTDLDVPPKVAAALRRMLNCQPELQPRWEIGIPIGYFHIDGVRYIWYFHTILLDKPEDGCRHAWTAPSVVRMSVAYMRVRDSNSIDDDTVETIFREEQEQMDKMVRDISTPE